MNPLNTSQTTKVVVATTVMLSFISFWRAAAIVLCDLASSAFYAGGIAETAVGKSAPWFILGIMLFAFAIRAVYVESCGMFVRGGVYKVVLEAMGGTLAKFSVSALMFDYVLTGPISGVSAGLYLAGLINELGELAHHPEFKVNSQYFAAVFAIAVVLYFWRKNIIGVHESSQKALRIMQLTTVMVVILIFWCPLSLAVKSVQPVPFPTLHTIKLDETALGWLKGTVLPSFTAIAILVGLGHSLLALSGFETLAQVNREIASPKLKNLERAGTISVVYALLSTSLVSFCAVALIPDSARGAFLDNLIGGLSMYLAGPLPLRLLFHGFVVLVGAVILSGAVNTAILGSNGVLNRVAEDGVLPDWFRHPHKRFGTTNRMINTVVILQITAIVISRGEIYLLGEAYALGVVWSFAMKALSVLVLRYKQPGAREWKVPLNLKLGRIEIPLGLGLITVALFVLAVTNLLTKKHATIAGGAFTLFFFVLFEITENYHQKKTRVRAQDQEKFLLETPQEVTADTVRIRPGNFLVPVRNPNALDHVKKTLEKTDTRKIDIVILTVKRVTEAGSGEYGLVAEQVFSDDISMLFSRVVSLAEKAGKHVDLMVVPGTDPTYAIVETAARLQSSTIVIGTSPRLSSSEQAKAFGDAWEKLPHPRPQVSLEIVYRDGVRSEYINLGPHPPRLWPEDVELVHRLWLELSGLGPGHNLHHRDVVRVALRRLDAELHAGQSKAIVSEVLGEAGGDERRKQDSGD
jgi:amino acid transporter